jgi:hypothetical protein
MSRITQCAAPLASLLLFAAAFAFVGTTAEAAVGFVENLAEAIPGIAPNGRSGRHLRLESSRLCREAPPRRNALPPRPPFIADVRL